MLIDVCPDKFRILICTAATCLCMCLDSILEIEFDSFMFEFLNQEFQLKLLDGWYQEFPLLLWARFVYIMGIRWMVLVRASICIMYLLILKQNG